MDSKALLTIKLPIYFNFNYFSLRISGDISDKVYGPYQSFKIHLKNFHESGERYIYPWTINKLSSINNVESDQKEVEKFIQEIFQNIQELIRVDKKQARKIVTRLPMKARDVSLYLDSYPELQIEMFENFLKEEKYRRSSIIGDTIKLKYIDLKCIHHPDQVTHALEIYNFPLNEALEICNKHKNYFASAFIKFRIGVKEQAIDEYLKVNIFNFTFFNFLR